MASNINSSTTNQQATRVQRYVDGQLEKTRRQVKSYELIVACLTWAVAVAAFFLVMALIDAWVVSFSTSWRWIALLALILGSAAWLLLAIVPLFLRKINLDYAAQMIEQATPDVKNTVLNYSLLRKHDEPINVAVMDAVSRQAAEKLNAIPSDTTIDRSQLIRVGFVLVGLMVFAVTYKLVSPRDPLQTVQRILFPGQLIAKPASVQISRVTPGNARVFFGDSLQVTARVKGPHRPEDVRLVISSDDGQITDFAIPMVPDETGREYQGLISPGDTGIQQPLNYRIEARDGVTPEYKIDVKANPSIAIETIDLTPPSYTGLPKRTLTGRGDIEAIEGTEAMIFAVANLPIEVAYIELLNAVPNDDTQNPNATIMKPAAPPIEMRLLPDNRASGRFNVALNSRRTRPNATHYQIRFVSTDDERNESPNVYPIRVTPDLAPEVRIVEPRSRQTNLAVNGRLPIRVEANDLDFAIDSVVLNMDHQGSQLVRRSLDLKSENGNQRVNGQFLFEPARYRLQPGDQVVFHAVASDNRISIKSLAPDPNVSQTENFTITITEADSESDQDQPPQERQPPDDRNSENSDQDSQDGDSGDEGQPMDDLSDETSEDESADQPDPSGNDETGDNGSEKDDGSPAGDEEGAEGSEANDNQQPQDGNQSPPAEGGQGSEQEQNGGSADQNQGGNQESSEAEGRNESRNDGTSDRGDPQGSSGDGGSQGEGEGSDSAANSDPSDSNSGGSPDGSGEQGPSGTNQNDPNAQASDSANEGGAAEGSQSNGGARSDPGDTNSDQQGTRDQSLKDGQRERLAKDAHDGEKFEKLDELLKDQEPSEGTPKETGDQPDGNRQDNQQPEGNSNQSNGQDAGNDPGQGDQSGDGSSDQQSTKPQSTEEQGSGGDQSGDQNAQPPEGTEASKGSQGSEGEPQSSGSPAGDQGQPSDKQGQPSEGSQSSSESPGDSGQSDPNQQPSDSQSESGSDSNTGQAGQPSQDPSQSSSQTSDGNSNGQSSEPSEGATTSGQQGSGAGTDQPNNEQLEKEQADLEHAKKATDLVLNKLEDQQNNPDPDLLDKMNWTEQDLREFLDRWKRMKQNAQTGDPNAQEQYEEAIKSLGLRPNDNSRTSKNRDADASGLNQDSSVIEPPADLAPDFNDFLRDRNRVR